MHDTIDKIKLNSGTFPALRLRRLRKTEAMRRLVRDVDLSPNQLILPIFIKEGINNPVAISSMPGHFQWPVSQLPDLLKQISKVPLGGVLLFGIPRDKDPQGSHACRDDGIIAQAIQIIKSHLPDCLVIADACFCEYTSHGHCGVIDGEYLDNDATLPLLAEQAVCLANAGADIIAPSGMLDGMVMAIRGALDGAGFIDTAILSYAVKYSSALYGPFREAAEGAPLFGDRRSYQMDPANRLEAVREVDLDVAEGADMLMVKPALAYLDIIQTVHQRYPQIPLAAYHVSGEYAMVKAAAERGWLDEQAVMMEHLLAIKRAGAKIIISYATLELMPLLLSR